MTVTTVNDDRFARAARHSRLVRRLRLLLPTLAVLGIVLFFVASIIKSWVADVGISSVTLQGTTLVMAKPHLNGFDSNRRPYTLVAETARQDITTPKQIALEKLNARLELAASGWVRVTSDTGFYNGDADSFHAQDNVHVTSSLTYEMFLKDADVNIKANAMQSDHPVEVRNNDNRIFADRLRVTGGGEVVIFDGNVHVIFTQPEERK